MYWARRVAQGIDHWRDRPDVWAPSLLVVIGILFFSDVLFSSKNFYFRDILNFHYPLRKVLIETYARGEFPLWNPFVHLGQPMLANPNYMAFYPTNLLHLFLPFDYAFKLHFIIHPILGGLGLYFLQRRLGIGPLAAFGGSLVYQFSGPVLSFLNLLGRVGNDCCAARQARAQLDLRDDPEPPGHFLRAATFSQRILARFRIGPSASAGIRRQTKSSLRHRASWFRWNTICIWAGRHSGPPDA